MKVASSPPLTTPRRHPTPLVERHVRNLLVIAAEAPANMDVAAAFIELEHRIVSVLGQHSWSGTALSSCAHEGQCNDQQQMDRATASLPAPPDGHTRVFLCAYFDQDTPTNLSSDLTRIVAIATLMSVWRPDWTVYIADPTALLQSRMPELTLPVRLVHGRPVDAQGSVRIDQLVVLRDCISNENNGLDTPSFRWAESDLATWAGTVAAGWTPAEPEAPPTRTPTAPQVVDTWSWIPQTSVNVGTSGLRIYGVKFTREAPEADGQSLCVAEVMLVGPERSLWQIEVRAVVLDDMGKPMGVLEDWEGPWAANDWQVVHPSELLPLSSDAVVDALELYASLQVRRRVPHSRPHVRHYSNGTAPRQTAWVSYVNDGPPGSFLVVHLTYLAANGAVVEEDEHAVRRPVPPGPGVVEIVDIDGPPEASVTEIRTEVFVIDSISVALGTVDRTGTWKEPGLNPRSLGLQMRANSSAPQAPNVRPDGAGDIPQVYLEPVQAVLTHPDPNVRRLANVSLQSTHGSHDSDDLVDLPEHLDPDEPSAPH